MAIKETVVPNINVSNNLERKFTGSYTVSDIFDVPKLRVRDIVISTLKLKPHTSMNLFLSGINVNSHFVPATMVEVTLQTGTKFTGVDSSVNFSKTLARQVGTDNWNEITRGEVISCAGGTAVVIADEVIFDKVSASNKRILYVTNIRGTLSGVITGEFAGTTATVVGVTAGARVANSLGNLHGVLQIPAVTFEAGTHKIMITDAASADPNAATTLADASYTSNGKINTHTVHNTYTEQNVTTVIDYTSTTWYDVEPADY